MTDSNDKPAAETPPEVEPVAAAEEPAADQAPAKPKSPARKIVLVSLAVLLAFYIYEVVADRVTPYTSQAAVDTFLVQIAPEVAGQVQQVPVTDNRAVKRGQVLFRIDPEPFEIA